MFYDDQLSTKECRLSEDIDKEYKLELQIKQVAAAESANTRKRRSISCLGA